MAYTVHRELFRSVFIVLKFLTVLERNPRYHTMQGNLFCEVVSSRSSGGAPGPGWLTCNVIGSLSFRYASL